MGAPAGRVDGSGRVVAPDRSSRFGDARPHDLRHRRRGDRAGVAAARSGLSAGPWGGGVPDCHEPAAVRPGQYPRQGAGLFRRGRVHRAGECRRRFRAGADRGASGNDGAMGIVAGGGDADDDHVRQLWRGYAACRLHAISACDLRIGKCRSRYKVFRGGLGRARRAGAIGAASGRGGRGRSAARY